MHVFFHEILYSLRHVDLLSYIFQDTKRQSKITVCFDRRNRLVEKKKKIVR